MTRYEPIVPDGQHLGTSHEVDGAVTGHLFSDGDNKLQGHAAWREVDDPEDDGASSFVYDHASSDEDEPPRQLTQEEIERAVELAALMILGIIKGVQWASPRVRGWWGGTAAPRFRSTWLRLRRQNRNKAETVDLVDGAPNPAKFVASSSGVEIAVAQSEVRMTGAEWAQRFQAMLAAGAFRDEQRRILAKAQIEDGERALERSGQEELSPQQFARHIQSFLEGKPSLLSEASSSEIRRQLIGD